MELGLHGKERTPTVSFPCIPFFPFAATGTPCARLAHSVFARPHHRSLSTIGPRGHPAEAVLSAGLPRALAPPVAFAHADACSLSLPTALEYSGLAPNRTGNWIPVTLIGPPSGSLVPWDRSRTEVLAEHVTVEVEGIDRMYLNVYVPALQRAGGVATFFRFHRGHQFASSVLINPITKTFIAHMEQFGEQQNVPLVQSQKGQRKDEVAAAYRKKFTGEEGVLFIGKA